MLGLKRIKQMDEAEDYGIGSACGRLAAGHRASAAVEAETANCRQCKTFST